MRFMSPHKRERAGSGRNKYDKQRHNTTGTHTSTHAHSCKYFSDHRLRKPSISFRETRNPKTKQTSLFNQANVGLVSFGKRLKVVPCLAMTHDSVPKTFLRLQIFESVITYIPCQKQLNLHHLFFDDLGLKSS